MVQLLAVELTVLIFLNSFQLAARGSVTEDTVGEFGKRLCREDGLRSKAMKLSDLKPCIT